MVVSKVQVVNNVNLVNNSTRELFPLGITASSGPGIPLLWGGFVALLLSVIPYMISCVPHQFQAVLGLTSFSDAALGKVNAIHED